MGKNLDFTRTVALARAETIQEILFSSMRALRATMRDLDARLQSEILLAHALAISRAQLLSRLNETLAPAIAAQYAAFIARRARGEPLAYIIEQQEFFQLDFFVDRRVLIPRHETETLVALAREAASQINFTTPVIVDVGTGSGTIALTLQHHLPRARVIATDISREALAVAQINARRLRLERIDFVESDLLESVDESFDILVANLPYIPSARYEKLPREIRDHEPRRALDGGHDGLTLIGRLMRQMNQRAAKNALAFLEISEEQGARALDLARQELPRARATAHRDLEGLDRVLELQWAK